MLKQSNYSEPYILFKGIIKVTNTAVIHAAANNLNKKAILKNFARFTDCISKIMHTQIDKSKDIYVVKPMYNFMECIDNNSKTSRDLCVFYTGEPVLDDDCNIFDFVTNNTTDSFRFSKKQKKVRQVMMKQRMLK